MSTPTPTPTPLLVQLLEEDSATGWWDSAVGLVLIGALVSFLSVVATATLQNRIAARERERLHAREDYLRWLPELVKAASLFSNTAQDNFEDYLRIRRAETAQDVSAAESTWLTSHQKLVDSGVSLSLLAPETLYVQAVAINDLLWGFQEDRTTQLARQSEQWNAAKLEFRTIARQYIHKEESL